MDNKDKDTPKKQRGRPLKAKTTEPVKEKVIKNGVKKVRPVSKKRAAKPPILKHILDTPNVAATDTAPNVTAEDEEFINKLIQHSVMRFNSSAEKTIKEYDAEMKVLRNVVSEHLDSFIIMGYAPDQRRVLIRYSPTAQGYDAVRDLSRQFIMQMLSNGGEMPDFF